MSVPSPPRRSWPRRFLNRLEVDQAVFFAVAVRAWQLLAGPVVMVLIARHFTLDVQGYYFTFGSLLALQSFAELGLRVVILNLASHEWSQLRLDERGRVAGDPDATSRLAILVRIATAWFVPAAAVFAVGVGAAGYVFFSIESGSDHADWNAPWLVLVGVTAAQIAVLPLLTVLDGCHQMKVVNRYRLLQAISATAGGCACIAAGGELWTAAVIAGTRLFWDAWVVGVRYGPFFLSLFRAPSSATMNWRDEILPLQWRLAAQTAPAWFTSYLFTPLMFHYHGEPEAARMGMTWAALTALQAAALAWVDTRAPLFGMLVARRDFRELDRVFFRVSGLALKLFALGAAAFWLLVAGLTRISPRDADRLLPIAPTILFSLGLLVYTATQCQSLYLRAHKRDPLLVPSMISHLLVGLAVWQLGARHGATGAAAGYLGAHLGFTLPCWTWVWRRCRRAWHRPGSMRAC